MPAVMCNCVYSRMLQRFSRIATNFFSLFLQFSHTSPVNTDPICVVFIFILMCQIDDKFIIVRLLISQGRSVDAMYQCTNVPTPHGRLNLNLSWYFMEMGHVHIN